MNRAGYQQLIVIFLLALTTTVKSQSNSAANHQLQKTIPTAPIAALSGSFGKAAAFVEQLGQYTDTVFPRAGKIYAGFESFSALVLFTANGLIFLQKKETKLSHEEERLERKGIPGKIL